MESLWTRYPNGRSLNLPGTFNATITGSLVTAAENQTCGICQKCCRYHAIEALWGLGVNSSMKGRTEGMANAHNIGKFESTDKLCADLLHETIQGLYFKKGLNILYRIRMVDRPTHVSDGRVATTLDDYDTQTSLEAKFQSYQWFLLYKYTRSFNYDRFSRH